MLEKFVKIYCYIPYISAWYPVLLKVVLIHLTSILLFLLFKVKVATKSPAKTIISTPFVKGEFSETFFKVVNFC